MGHQVRAARDSDLIVGTRYLAGQGLAGEPIGKLLPVGNRGGIRFGGSLGAPHYVTLFSTFAEEEWPDRFDGDRLVYWGDNRTAGQDLHSTPKHGNALLRNIFMAAWDPLLRGRVPLITLFGHEPGTRDVTLLAFLVPGVPEVAEGDGLPAVWRRSPSGWFQNYRASFTALPETSLSRDTVDAWPTMAVNQRLDALAGFRSWVESP